MSIGDPTGRRGERDERVGADHAPQELPGKGTRIDLEQVVAGRAATADSVFEDLPPYRPPTFSLNAARLSRAQRMPPVKEDRD